MPCFRNPDSKSLQMTVGRPTNYTPDIATSICAEIASGRKVSEICEADDMPGERTVYRWLGVHDEFRQQYARAMEQRTEAMAEETLEIADNLLGDPARDRLRVDTRKWLMSKMAPKKYGDKVQQEVSGPNGGPIETRELGARDIIAGKLSSIAARAGTQRDPGESE